MDSVISGKGERTETEEGSSKFLTLPTTIGLDLVIMQLNCCFRLKNKEDIVYSLVV